MYNPYITLDTDAYFDPKVVNARIKHGPVAFTVFVFLLSAMSREELCMLSCKDYAAFAHLIGVDEETVRSVVEDFGLFKILDDGQTFYSNELSRRVEKKKRISEERKAAAKKRWQSDTDPTDKGPDKPGGGSGRPRRPKKSQPAAQATVPVPAEKTNTVSSLTAPQTSEPLRQAVAPETVPSDERPEPLTVADEVAILRRQATWIAGVCDARNLTPEQLDSLLNEFVQTCTRPTHGGAGISLEAQLQDCRSHIYHWLPIRLSRKTTSEPIKSVAHQQPYEYSDFGEAARQRRAAEAEERESKCMSADDYIRSEGYDPANGITLAMVLSPAWRANNPPTIAV